MSQDRRNPPPVEQHCGQSVLESCPHDPGFRGRICCTRTPTNGAVAPWKCSVDQASHMHKIETLPCHAPPLLTACVTPCALPSRANTLFAKHNPLVQRLSYRSGLSGCIGQLVPGQKPVVPLFHASGKPVNNRALSLRSLLGRKQAPGRAQRVEGLQHTRALPRRPSALRCVKLCSSHCTQ
jgi:hypothetical protein